MKNKVNTIKAFAMIAVLAVGTAAGAAQVRLHTLSGQVMKIDSAMKTVTLKGTVGKKENEVVFHLAPDASITRNNQKAALDTFKTGDPVIVRYASVKGTLTAHSIASPGKDVKPAAMNKY